jgi:hypothetical protein
MNKLGSHGLEIIAVGRNNAERLGAFFATGVFSIPIIFDHKNKISKLFKIDACCGGTIVSGRDGVIRFRLGSVAEKEDIRQLVEKELIGSITYDFETPRRFTNLDLTGKPLNIVLRDQQSGYQRGLETFYEDYLVITFFSSICGPCKSGRRLETLKRLQRGSRKWMRSSRILTVFGLPFDEADIKEWEKTIDIPFAKFISDDIFTDNHKYITDDTLKVEPFTIVLDKNRRPIFVEELGMTEDLIHDVIFQIVAN